MQIRGPESIRSLGLSVSGIQAALRWGHDSNYNTYLFKSGSYWRFSPREQRVESVYPRSMKDWSGIPDDVDATFRDVYGTVQGKTNQVKEFLSENVPRGLIDNPDIFLFFVL